MADLSDVESTLVGLAVEALYPQGTAASSVIGSLCRIYRGWPEAGALEADLAAGVVNISIFPEAAEQRNTTRHMDQWIVPAPVAVGLTVTITGNTVTFGGSAGGRQLAGVLADGKTYVYRTRDGDSVALVAANLATMLREDRIVLLANTSIVIPGVARLLARTTAEQPGLLPVRRQEQGFRISCWCPDPATRDAVAGALDSSLARLRFILLPDGTAGRLLFRSTQVQDRAEDAELYRRDLVYSVEYATTWSQDLPTFLFGEVAYGTAGVVSATLIG